LASWV